MKLIVNPSALQEESNSLGDYCSQLNDLSQQLNDVFKASALSCSSYNGLRTSIAEIKDALMMEQTQLNQLKSTLLQITNAYITTEDKLKNVTKNTEAKSATADNSWEDYVVQFEDFSDEQWYNILSSVLVGGVLGEGTISAINKLLNGTYITSKTINNIVYVKLAQNGMTNKQIAEWLSKNIGGKWDDYLARNLKDYNLAVYNKVTGKYMKDINIFSNVIDRDLAKSFANLSSTFTDTFSSSIFDDFDYKDFKSLTKFEKVGKVLGTVGTGLTIATDVFDNFYDPKTSSWSFSGNQVADCTLDIGVDLTSSAGCIAAGTTIGTALGGPVGTVVGVASGVVLDVAINYDFYDFDGDGSKDSLVDGVKIAGHKVVDKVEDVCEDVGDWIGDVFGFN